MTLAEPSLLLIWVLWSLPEREPADPIKKRSYVTSKVDSVPPYGSRSPNAKMSISWASEQALRRGIDDDELTPPPRAQLSYGSCRPADDDDLIQLWSNKAINKTGTERQYGQHWQHWPSRAPECSSAFLVSHLVRSPQALSLSCIRSSSCTSPERYVFTGTCSVTTAPVGAFTYYKKQWYAWD